MNTRDPFGFGALLVRAAVTVLVVAVCLHWAARLIADVWPWLLGIGLVIGSGIAAWRIIRYRQSHW